MSSDSERKKERAAAAGDPLPPVGRYGRVAIESGEQSSEQDPSPDS